MAVGLTSYILDTSAYSGFNRGDQHLRPWFDIKYTIIVPLIVVGELRAGFAAGSKTVENERLLGRFLDAPNVQQLPITLETTQKFAALYLQIRKSGKAIGTNNLWIFALALEHGLPILTLDKDFHKVNGIRILEV